jgi:hypothetical protein
VVLKVDGHGTMQVTDILGRANGTLWRDAWDCPVPAEPISLTVDYGSPDRVRPSVVDKTCRLVTD